MAIKYEVKKVVFGFDKTNTEKFVAQTKVLGLVKFDKLCEEVQKVSMAPRGVDIPCSWETSAVSVPD